METKLPHYQPEGTIALAPILHRMTVLAITHDAHSHAHALTVTREQNSSSALTARPHHFFSGGHTMNFKSQLQAKVMYRNSTSTSTNTSIRQPLSLLLPLHHSLQPKNHHWNNTTVLAKELGTTRETVPVDSKATALVSAFVSSSSSSSSSSPLRDFPWRKAAPVIDTAIPTWIEAYVQFHNESLHRVHNSLGTQKSTNTTTHDALKNIYEMDKNKYFIFQCRKSCSGTGNRQRAIFAAFMVAMVSKRIFLIDETYPVRLDSILHPHLIQWNWFPPHLIEQQQQRATKDSKYQKVLKVRNKNPPVLDYPSRFMNGGEWSDYPVIRIEANNPVNMEQLWKRAEIRAYLEKFNVSRSFTVPGTLYKQIFWTLFRPSEALTERAVALRKELGVMRKQKNENLNTTTPTNSEEEMEKYIVIHARTGGGGLGWKDDDRFTTDNIDLLYARAKAMRSHFLNKGGSNDDNSKNKNNNTQNDNNLPVFPIIVVSDEAKAKEIIKQIDPNVVRIANTKIVHVDRSKRKANDLEGSLAVWADLLIIAQATCIVKGRGSFSMLGAWLASKTFGGTCMQLVI